jgi:TPR repeat protein
MRVLFVLTFLTALILPSGHAPASPPSDISAEVLHKQAAQGDAWAQHNLGVLYDNGRGVPQDYVKARGWYEKAAAQGNPWAQHSLGVLYDNGRGVPQDYVKARDWYEKAAAQGNPWAQHNLGVLYDNGRGVPQDYVKAYMWLDLAAAQLTSNGKKLAVDNRDDAARHMTPARFTEAQRLSQQCQARQFKGC